MYTCAHTKLCLVLLMSSLLVQCDCINPPASARKHHTTPRTNHPTPAPNKKLLAILNDPGIQQQLEDLFLHLYNILALHKQEATPLYVATEVNRETVVELLLELGWILTKLTKTELPPFIQGYGAR